VEEAILTWKVRLERKDLMNTPMFPRKPKEDNCWRIWYRHVVSYAFSRSKNMDNTDSWRANADVILGHFSGAKKLSNYIRVLFSFATLPWADRDSNAADVSTLLPQVRLHPHS
jgi:hypothetical protein